MSLNIDLQPLWDAINANFPVFLAVLAIPGGIAIAVVLANWIIGKVQSAFSGAGKSK